MPVTKAKGPEVRFPTPAATRPSVASAESTTASSKKKKKKKGKGKVVDNGTGQNGALPVGSVPHSKDDGADEEDEDDLPGLDPARNQPYPHYEGDQLRPNPTPTVTMGPPGSRTGLTPELESVHLTTSAKLNATGPRMTSTETAQAELLAAANELYRRMETETREGNGDYWAQLPSHIRSFVETTYAHAQTVVDEAHARAQATGQFTYPTGPLDSPMLSEADWAKFAMRPSQMMTRTGNFHPGAYGDEHYDEYPSDPEDDEGGEDVDVEQATYESTDATSKKKKKKKKKSGAGNANQRQQQQQQQQLHQQVQQLQTQTPTQPPPKPNPPPIMPTPPPLVPTITRAPPSAAQPPPSSRAAGKQPMKAQPMAPNSNNSNPRQPAANGGRTASHQQQQQQQQQQGYNASTNGTNTPANGKRTAPSHNPISTKDSKNKLWSNSSEEERERIKEFWLGLSEVERRDLVKLEKEAVLRKMKEQQKHSCSCAVCGRKRNAIEEELEVLYDAYYEELEQYANRQQQYVTSGGKITPPPGPGPFPGSVAYDHNGLIVPSNTKADVRKAHLGAVNGRGAVPPSQKRTAVPTESDDYDDEEDEDDYDDEEEEDYDDEEEEEEEDLPPRGAQRRGVNGDRGSRSDFLNFGTLTAAGPGNILTVADDLLKNDGQKFLEMMEQLAERRMQREEEAARGVDDPDSEDEDDEEGSEDLDDDDDGEDEESEEDDEPILSEEQKMEEGRRMFSIFAARMFEQRVLTAYRERVASRRQEEFLKELEAEDKQQAERDAKKAKEAQKKKDKKKLQKQAKEAEKAKREAEKAAEEAATKAKQEAAEEEARKRREEDKAKREAERKSREEEKARAAEERRLRIAEQKAAEAEKRREKEERERKERMVRLEREAQQRAEKAERERKAKEERLAKEAKEKEERERKEREEAERKEKERQEQLRIDKERQEATAKALASANAMAAANAENARAAKAAAVAAAQAQAQAQAAAVAAAAATPSPPTNPPTISPRSGSFPPGINTPPPPAKKQSLPTGPPKPPVAGPSVQRPPPPLNRVPPPPGLAPQGRGMMLPHALQPPPMMNVPMPPPMHMVPQNLPMGFNPHGSSIPISPRGPFSHTPFPPGLPFGPSPGQQLPTPILPGSMNRNFNGPIDFGAFDPAAQPPPTPASQSASQHTPILGILPQQNPLATPSATSSVPLVTPPVNSQTTPVNGFLALGSVSSPSNAPNQGTPGPNTHNRRPSVPIPPNQSVFSAITKPPPTSTISGTPRSSGAGIIGSGHPGPSSLVGENDERVILPPRRRTDVGMDDRILGSSALVDDDDAFVTLPKKRAGLTSAPGWDAAPGSRSIWSTGNKSSGLWPSAPGPIGPTTNGPMNVATNPWAAAPPPPGISLARPANLLPLSKGNPPFSPTNPPA